MRGASRPSSTTMVPALLLVVFAVTLVLQMPIIAATSSCGCADFCADRCAFNATAPQTLSLFRRTPASDLRLPNHDTGSSVGDAEFSLYSFSYAYQCRAGGSPRDCSFLQNDTVYAEFTVEVDGQFGPYLACNPNLTSSPPHIFGCVVHGGPPEWSSCREQWSRPESSCPRLLRTVGKMPVDYACSASEASGGRSPIWSVWKCNVSKLFARAIDQNHSENEQAWFSTPRGGECVGSARPGDGSGCTWRAKLKKVVAAEVVDDAIAQLVQAHAPQRFQRCNTADRGSLCWSTAFFDTITGNNSRGAPPLPPSVLSAAWRGAFNAAPNEKHGLATLKTDDDPAAVTTAASNITVTSLSHSMLAVEGVTQLVVRGTGFFESPHAVCQVSNQPGAAVSFDTHTVAATILNATTLLCTPASVHSDGLGALAVSMDNKTFSANATIPIRFFPLFSVAVGRRPYVHEVAGQVLIDPGGRSSRGSIWEEAMLALTGGSCTANASIGPHHIGAAALDLSAGRATALEFDLTKLPATLVERLSVFIACQSGIHVVKYREFQRYPPPPSDGGSVSQVDHLHSGLLVDGEPWLGVGWYYSLLDSVSSNFQNS